MVKRTIPVNSVRSLVFRKIFANCIARITPHNNRQIVARVFLQFQQGKLSMMHVNMVLSRIIPKYDLYVKCMMLIFHLYNTNNRKLATTMQSACKCCLTYEANCKHPVCGHIVTCYDCLLYEDCPFCNIDMGTESDS